MLCSPVALFLVAGISLGLLAHLIELLATYFYEDTLKKVFQADPPRIIEALKPRFVDMIRTIPINMLQQVMLPVQASRMHQLQWTVFGRQCSENSFIFTLPIVVILVLYVARTKKCFF